MKYIVDSEHKKCRKKQAFPFGMRYHYDAEYLYALDYVHIVDVYVLRCNVRITNIDSQLIEYSVFIFIYEVFELVC